MNLTPEVQACISKAAEEASTRTRNDIFGLLGIEDNEDGRQSLKALGDFAKLWGDVRHEARRQGIKGTVKGIYWLFKLLVLGGIAYIAWKSGIVGR